MVERAQRALEDVAVENVRVQVGDAEAPPVEPGSVDAIVASLLLFFLPNSEVALDAYAHALVAGGTLAFSTFGVDDDWTPFDRILARFTPDPPFAQEGTWSESRDTIRSPLDAHRFEEVPIDEVRHQATFPTVPAFHQWCWSTARAPLGWPSLSSAATTAGRQPTSISTRGTSATGRSGWRRAFATRERRPRRPA
jgi:SAM-dependent methyltransferase